MTTSERDRHHPLDTPHTPWEDAPTMNTREHDLTDEHADQTAHEHGDQTAHGHGDQAVQGQAGDARAEPPVDVKQEVFKQLGGTAGMIYTTLPVVVFAAAVAFTSLTVAIGTAIALALILAAYRMWRGEQFMAAIGGVLGVAVAGGISAWTGSANDFFLIGIWASLAGGIVTLVSLLARRPLTGLIWNAVHGNTHPWRQDRAVLRVHDLATLAITAVFTARFVVRQWLYLADSTTGLAIADTVTGIPLTALAAVAVIWAFRRSTKRLIRPTAE